MKTLLKDNFFVKSSYSYVNLFYMLFPVLIVVLFLPMIFGFPLTGHKSPVALLNVDLFNLFGKEKFIDEINLGNILFWLLILAANLTVGLGIFFGLKKLKRFMKNVYEDKPFIGENGEYLKTTGIIIMLLSTIIYLSHVSSQFISPPPVSAWIKILYFVSILISTLFNPYLVVGLLIFVIGEIIVRAAELKEEQDLTV